MLCQHSATSMVERRNDAFLQGSVTKCTLEDFEVTYAKLKELGPEELKHRLVALKEIQKTVDDVKAAMTREAKTLIQENSRNSLDKEKRQGGNLLSLPRLFPAICKVDRIAGYQDVLSSNEKLKTYPEEGKAKSGKSKKKHLRRISQKDGTLCINCQMEAMHETSWLPQLEGAKTTGNIPRRGRKAEKVVLPELKVSKYQ